AASGRNRNRTVPIGHHRGGRRVVDVGEGQPPHDRDGLGAADEKGRAKDGECRGAAPRETKQANQFHKGEFLFQRCSNCQFLWADCSILPQGRQRKNAVVTPKSPCQPKCKLPSFIGPCRDKPRLRPQGCPESPAAAFPRHCSLIAFSQPPRLPRSAPPTARPSHIVSGKRCSGRLPSDRCPKEETYISRWPCLLNWILTYRATTTASHPDRIASTRKLQTRRPSNTAHTCANPPTDQPVERSHTCPR